MNEMTLAAKIENMDEATAFINEELERGGCPMKKLLQINIAVEEIFVNIARYAYAPGEGDVTIACAVEADPLCAVIRFADSGVPYNPLAKEDPDISLSAEERSIGGLGIYMVKKSMDAVEYEYADGQNILVLRKRL